VTDPRRYLMLNAYLRNSGYHEAAWRVSPPARQHPGPRNYIDLAQTASAVSSTRSSCPIAGGGAVPR